MFPQCFPVSHTGNIVSSVSFCFQDANYACTLHGREFLTKIRARKQSQKNCEHEQASTYDHCSSNFCEQFEQRPNFASTFRLEWTIRYPHTQKRFPEICPADDLALCKITLNFKGTRPENIQ